MSEVKEYIVYMTPIDTILLDWNGTLWKYGYPAFSKSVCREIARGHSEGGAALANLHAELRKQYEIPQTKEQVAAKFEKWKLERALGQI